MTSIEERGKLLPAQVAEALRRILFADNEENVFAVLDGASIPDLLPHLEQDQPDHVCLYRGELEEDLAAAAPYLVRLTPDSPFTDWLLCEGWGKHWGIFAIAKADLKAMRKHFRTFLLVKSPDGENLYFRYYDPRVLGIYLPTTNAGERQTFFGEIAALHCETPNGQLVTFRRVNDQLEQRASALE